MRGRQLVAVYKMCNVPKKYPGFTKYKLLDRALNAIIRQGYEPKEAVGWLGLDKIRRRSIRKWIRQLRKEGKHERLRK